MRWPLLAGQMLLWTLTSSAQRSNVPSNPFLGQKFYVNPARQEDYDKSIETADGQVRINLEIMRNQSSAYWIDSTKKIFGSTTETVEGILASASSKSPPELVVFIWYNLPNRDCEGQAQNVEICCTSNSDSSCDYAAASDCADGIEEYKSKYVDPFIGLLEKYNGLLPVVIVFEPNSLTNLVANVDNQNCANEATQNAYKLGTKYALEQLVLKTEATVYIDAGHGALLGSEASTIKFMDLLKELDLPMHGIRGFSTDVSGYQPLGIMCPWEGDVGYRNGYCMIGHQDDPCCRDPCSLLSKEKINNELNYAQQVHMAANGILGMNAHIIIDTSRNGVEDMRADCAEWCNIRGAGAGILPTADAPNPDIIDAYTWLKPPGESDGCTMLLPDDRPCPRFENMCASQASIGSGPDEPRAPQAGKWFDYQVKQLAANARFALLLAPEKGANDIVEMPNSFLQSRHLRGLSDVRRAMLLQSSSDVRTADTFVLEDESPVEGTSVEL